MKKGWLTPDSDPVGTIPITLNIPDDTDWLPALKGAILLLCDARNWEQYGSVTPEEAASRWQQIFFEVWP